MLGVKTNTEAADCLMGVFGYKRTEFNKPMKTADQGTVQQLKADGWSITQIVKHLMTTAQFRGKPRRGVYAWVSWRYKDLPLTMAFRDPKTKIEYRILRRGWETYMEIVKGAKVTIKNLTNVQQGLDYIDKQLA